MLNSLTQPPPSLPTKRKPGPSKRLQNVRPVTVLIDEDLIEWGKGQPGGLSELVRQLLHNKKSNESR